MISRRVQVHIKASFLERIIALVGRPRSHRREVWRSYFLELWRTGQHRGGHHRHSSEMRYLPQRTEHRCCHLHRTGQGKHPLSWLLLVFIFYLRHKNRHSMNCALFFFLLIVFANPVNSQDESSPVGYLTNLKHRPGIFPHWFTIWVYWRQSEWI